LPLSLIIVVRKAVSQPSPLAPRVRSTSLQLANRFMRYECFPQDDAAEASLKAASYLEQAQAVLDKRSAVYQSYDDAISKFKASKDAGALASQRKKIDADHKQLTQQIADIQAIVKPLAPEAADKVRSQSLRASCLPARAAAAPPPTRAARRPQPGSSVLFSQSEPSL